MKVAFISFGYADSTVSTVKHLSLHCEVDLYFTFSLVRKKNNIIDFENLQTSTGLQPDDIVHKAFSQEIKSYLKTISALKLFMYHNLSLRSWKNWRLAFKFAKLLKEYDVIHFNGDHGILPLLILLLKKKHLVFSIHDWECHSGEANVSPLKKWVRKFQINSNHPIIIQNKNDYNSLIKKYVSRKEKIFYAPFGYLEIYNQYDTKVKSDNNSHSDILFFGRISKYKGIEYLIEAFKHVKQEIPKAKLIIAGSGKLPSNNKKYKDDKQIIIINKFLDSKEMVQLIKHTKVVACPYLDSSQSGVAMTAFAFNKPIIATNTGGFPDIISNDINGLLVQPKNAKELANALIKILSDEQLREKMEHNIKNNLNFEEFNWENISSKIYSIYKKTAH